MEKPQDRLENSLINDSVRPELAEIHLCLKAAERRREMAEQSYGSYIDEQVDGIIEAFQKVGELHAERPGTEIHSEQRHFCLEDSIHQDVYASLAKKLGLFETVEAAKEDFKTITDRAREIGSSTPIDKVAVMTHIHPIEGPNFSNLAVVIADHLHPDGRKYAISIEPCVVEEWHANELHNNAAVDVE